MKRQSDLFCNEQFFNYDNQLVVKGNVHIKNNASINELIVEGDCFVEGSLVTKKLVVLGNLYANRLRAEDLEVLGDAEIEILSGYYLKFAHNLIVSKANLNLSILVVGEHIQVDYISGDLAQITIGKLA